MSLAGAIVATIAMGAMKKTNYFGMVGVSVIGSIFHCIGQIIAGIFVIGSTAVLWYLPIMLFLSIPSGILTGIIAKRFIASWQTWHNEVS